MSGIRERMQVAQALGMVVGPVKFAYNTPAWSCFTSHRVESEGVLWMDDGHHETPLLVWEYGRRRSTCLQEREVQP